MIAYLKGIITYIENDSIVIDINGVGYEVICANPIAFQALLQQEAFVFTYHHVREDSQVLYGFKHADEKSLFMKLLQVSGIGPKGALNILATVDVGEFAAAVEREDDAFLTKFPGVGKKTARQVILDLKGKLQMMLPEAAVQSELKKEIPLRNNGLDEAKEALKALGYLDKEIRAILPELKKDTDLKTDEIIRKALVLLAKS